MEHIVGIDLHSNNGYYAIVETDGKRVFEKRIPNEMSMVLSSLEPFKKTITSVVVESTYNWYWLVDGLLENGYTVKLGNPAGFGRYSGRKHEDDKTDAFFLTEMERLNILPQGYIYPKEERAVRDMLRRRMLIVQHKTSHMLSFQSLIMRQTGSKISSGAIRKLHESDVENLLDEEYLALTGQTNIAIIRFLREKIRHLERAVLKRAKLRPEFERLMTVPGIGIILALTIMMETGDIGRFAGNGKYASYCRLVKSKRISNGKTKGKGNSKNGNKYLCWAYVEAANYSRRFCPEAKKFYQRKLAKTNQAVATKALACKIAKACFFMMRDQVDFDVKKIFG